MALITCPECGRLVSDRAAACPSCGFPLASVAKEEGVFVLQRNADARFAAGRYEVYLDDRYWGALGDGERLDAPLACGTHQLRIVDTTNSDWTLYDEPFRLGRETLTYSFSSAPIRLTMASSTAPVTADSFDRTRSAGVRTRSAPQSAAYEEPASAPPGSRCPKCGSANVNYQVFQENTGTTTVSRTRSKYKEKGHGCLWWLLVGWWWWIVDLCLWLCFFPIRAIVALTKKKKYKGTSTTVSQSTNHLSYKTMCVCANCGNTWTKT